MVPASSRGSSRNCVKRNRYGTWRQRGVMGLPFIRLQPSTRYRGGSGNSTSKKVRARKRWPGWRTVWPSTCGTSSVPPETSLSGPGSRTDSLLKNSAPKCIHTVALFFEKLCLSHHAQCCLFLSHSSHCWAQWRWGHILLLGPNFIWIIVTRQTVLPRTNMPLCFQLIVESTNKYMRDTCFVGCAVAQMDSCSFSPWGPRLKHMLVCHMWWTEWLWDKFVLSTSVSPVYHSTNTHTH